jgi:hypothetical protein
MIIPDVYTFTLGSPSGSALRAPSPGADTVPTVYRDKKSPKGPASGQ